MRIHYLRFVLPLVASGILFGEPPLWEGDAMRIVEAGSGRQSYVMPVASSAQLPTEVEDPKTIRLYRLSVAALVTANAVDASSSWGKHERNGALAGSGGVFDQRSLLLKAGIMGAMVVTQLIFGRGSGKARRIATIMNFTTAAAYGTAAVYNYRVRR